MSAAPVSPAPATTLAACWRLASHFELDGLPARAEVIDASSMRSAPLAGLGPSNTLYQLCDTNLRVVAFADQPLQLQADGVALLQPFMGPASVRADQAVRVRFLIARPLTAVGAEQRRAHTAAPADQTIAPGRPVPCPAHADLPPFA